MSARKVLGFWFIQGNGEKSYCQSYFKRRMGLPKTHSCREAPFRYWVVLFTGAVMVLQPWLLHTFGFGLSDYSALSWITSPRQSLGLYKPPSSFPYLLTLTFPICRTKIWVQCRIPRFVVFLFLSYRVFLSGFSLSYRVFLSGFPDRQRQRYIIGLHFFSQPCHQPCHTVFWKYLFRKGECLFRINRIFASHEMQVHLKVTVFILHYKRN